MRKASRWRGGEGAPHQRVPRLLLALRRWGGWKYEFSSQPYLEQEQTLQLDGKGPTLLTLPLAAGWYRLEVENSQGHQSSLQVEIGQLRLGRRWRAGTARQDCHHPRQARLSGG